MSIKFEDSVSPHEVVWWHTNIRGVVPPDVGLNFAKVDGVVSNESVLLHELLGTGLNKTQAQIVAKEGFAGLHTITAAGGTGYTTPVIQEVFLRVVHILTARGDDNVHRESAGTNNDTCSG